MRLPAEAKQEVQRVVDRWCDSPTDLPLIISKAEDGVWCTKALPKQRYTKVEFAAELNVHRNTFAKIEERFCLSPDSGGMYSRETVEDVKRWLRNEEDRRAPRQKH